MTASNAHEDRRLAVLESYGILDTPPELVFDCITELTQTALKMPIVAISLVDRHRQWFKSRRGLAVQETPREISFCTDAIRGEAPMLVPDALADPSYRDSPLVSESPAIRFYAGAPLRARDGFNLGTLCVADTRPRRMTPRQVEILTGFARLVVHELELRRMASSDAQTGVLARGAFMAMGAREFDRAVRYRRALSCLVLDIDHFKAVNDSHGHAAGDLVLQEVVEVCGRLLRPADTLGRIGGEEFAVLLPETGGRGALQVAERIRRQVAGLSVALDSARIEITISIGLATCGRHEVDFQALLQRADHALYGAKRAGRDRVAAAEPLHAGDCPPCGAARREAG